MNKQQIANIIAEPAFREWIGEVNFHIRKTIPTQSVSTLEPWAYAQACVNEMDPKEAAIRSICATVWNRRKRVGWMEENEQVMPVVRWA